MATTFKNIQDDVKDICQELQMEADFNAVRIKRMINRGYYTFLRDTECYWVTLTITTTANQEFYTVLDLANWAFVRKVISVKYVTETSEFGKVLRPYPGGHSALPKDKSYGEPSYYYLVGVDRDSHKLGTYPIIDASSESLVVQAVLSPTADLSADGDIPVVPDTYVDALTYYAVWRLFHAYSHKNAAYRAKALEFKNLYKEVVNDYQFQSLENHYDGIQVTDVYGQYQY